MENLVVNAIKTLDKTGRQNLAKLVRTDPNVWNGVHGNGDASIDLPLGRIIGIVKREGELLKDATVKAIKGEESFEVLTNDEGVYSIELVPGAYDLLYQKEGYYDTPIDGETVIAETEKTVNAEMTKL